MPNIATFCFCLHFCGQQVSRVKWYFNEKKKSLLCSGCKAYLNSSVAEAIFGYEIHAGDL